MRRPNSRSTGRGMGRNLEREASCAGSCGSLDSFAGPAPPAVIREGLVLGVFAFGEESAAFFVLAVVQGSGAVHTEQFIIIVVVDCAHAVLQVGALAAAADVVGLKESLEVGDGAEEGFGGVAFYFDYQPSVSCFVVGFHLETFGRGQVSSSDPPPRSTRAHPSAGK
jgi:hypothetical protein